MDCKPRCAACCIAPSITSPIPGMPNGKPAGLPCIQLDADLRCKLFGQPERPPFCSSLQPQIEMCGDADAPREFALQWLSRLELATRPTLHGNHSGH